MNLLYISISGNTRSFLKRLQSFAEEQKRVNTNAVTFTLKEIDDNCLFESELEPFIAFVPTYLEGGNGVDNGTQEILTETLREYIEFENNASRCLGVVGSGNKNFNRQYCLTAKQYAQQFDVPMLEDFELRGTSADIERIYAILSDLGDNS